MVKISNETCRKLFAERFQTISSQELEKVRGYAQEILENNSWSDVFWHFNHYLRNECQNEDDVINFVYWFVDDLGLSFSIPSEYDPYDLVGYILSKIDLEKRWDDCGGILDDFANVALRINLMKDPCYQFWRDPKIIEICKRYGGRDYGLPQATV